LISAPAGADIKTKQETQKQRPTFPRPSTESAKESGHYPAPCVALLERLANQASQDAGLSAWMERFAHISHRPPLNGSAGLPAQGEQIDARFQKVLAWIDENAASKWMM